MQAHVSEIYRYPIKSCRGHRLEYSNLDRFGIVGDRRCMLIDDKGRFVTQRQLAKLTMLVPELHSDRITITHKESAIEINLEGLSEQRLASVWKDTITVLDAGDEISQWLSEELNRSLRLVYMPEVCDRLVDNHYAKNNQTVSFADGFPILLTTQSSLDLLNSRLLSPIPMDRFRPNIVIAGCDPHAEDNWGKIRIGTVEFEVAKPCSRCVIPSIDQITGDKNNEILERLREYRLGRDKQIYFGQNLLYKYDADSVATISVGDVVEVIA